MEAFAINNYLPVAPALTAFVAIGATPTFAQDGNHTGGTLPCHYSSTGAQVHGSWVPQAPTTVQRVAPSSRPLYMYAPHGIKHR